MKTRANASLLFLFFPLLRLPIRVSIHKDVTVWYNGLEDLIPARFRSSRSTSGHPHRRRRRDVRGAGYMSAAKLNGIVDENLEEVEIAVGIRILMVNIDECMTPYESCESGGCESVLHVNATPALVNTNQTALVRYLSLSYRCSKIHSLHHSSHK